MVKIILILSLLAVAIFVLSVPIEGQGNDIQVDTKVAPQGLLKRIKLFDFNRFTTTFGRKYKNVIERAMRQAVYLANTVKIFVHNILYSKKQSDYYLAVTPLADKTEAELHALYPDANNHSFKESGSSNQAPVDAKTEAVDEATLARELFDLIEKHEPGHELIKEALIDRIESQTSNDRTKRSIEDEEKEKETVTHKPGRLLKRPVPDELRQVKNEKPKRKISYVLKDENPEFEMPMTMSQGMHDQTVEPVSEQDKSWIGGFMANSARWVHNQLASLNSQISHDEDGESSGHESDFLENEIQAEKAKELDRNDHDEVPKTTVNPFDSENYEEINSEDRDFWSKLLDYLKPGNDRIDDNDGEPGPEDERELEELWNQIESKRNISMTTDWRTGECFTPIRDQKDCGGCWAFAAVAMLEYEYCRQRDEYALLSEQYYIDCGPIFHANQLNLNGCNGGIMEKVFYLINHYGALLQNDHPYVAAQGTCPYGNNPYKIPARQMGRVRPIVVMHNYWLREEAYHKIDRLLIKGPVVISIFTSPDFPFYGGGVHSNAGSKPGERAHAMLIVGDGVENGVPFWVFRNSHSNVWGEEGYYRLSKNLSPSSVNVVVDWTVIYSL